MDTFQAALSLRVLSTKWRVSSLGVSFKQHYR